MTVMATILAFLLAIGVLVTIHELGHYWAARWCDVKILRFSIGFGRPLLLVRRGADQTEWVVAALPLGGYVKMADERDESVAPADRLRAFNNKSVWQRSFIVLAGPAANFLLAALFYWVLLIAGLPGVKPILASPLPGSAAEVAGFREFERITAVGDRAVETWGDARMALLEQAVDRGRVGIAVEDDAGRRFHRELDLSGVTRDDLDRDFLGKVGLGPYRGRATLVLDEVAPGGAAARAGLQVGDRLVAVDGVPLERFDQLVAKVSISAGQVLQFELLRGGETRFIDVTPQRVEEHGSATGRIGVRPRVDRSGVEKTRTVVRAGPLEAIPKAWAKVWDMSVFSLKMMGRMLTGDVSWKNLSGPVTIADYAGQTALMGWMPYVNFLALISISLGVLNLLPIPVLDGGQLMYHIVEILKGSPVSERFMQLGQQAGLALLLGLTAFAFYNDIHRLLTG
ncbi:MAG TPA: RIP metalloprotease RseP [Usitatibacteraceae bacterium]|nr:RIP metalloprotease RseP [Usitatibacteraceae bacterium]